MKKQIVEPPYMPPPILLESLPDLCLTKQTVKINGDRYLYSYLEENSAPEVSKSASKGEPTVTLENGQEIGKP